MDAIVDPGPAGHGPAPPIVGLAGLDGVVGVDPGPGGDGAVVVNLIGEDLA